MGPCCRWIRIIKIRKVIIGRNKCNWGWSRSRKKNNKVCIVVMVIDWFNNNNDDLLLRILIY